MDFNALNKERPKKSAISSSGQWSFCRSMRGSFQSAMISCSVFQPVLFAKRIFRTCPKTLITTGNLERLPQEIFIFMVTLTLEVFILNSLSFVIIFANYILVFSSPCLALKDLSLRQMPSIAAFRNSLSSAKFKVHFLSCVVELFTLYSSFYPVLQCFLYCNICRFFQALIFILITYYF